VIGTLQQLKDYLGIEDDKGDVRLNAALTSATSMINAYCRRKSFESAVYTAELYDGTGTDTLQLDSIPITAVATVLEAGVALVVGLDPNANPKPEVIWYAEEGHLVRPFSRWWAYRRYYSVTYTAGYTTATMPPLIVQAALDQAALINKEKDRIGMNNKTLGQQTTSFARELPKGVKDALDYYRDLSICRRVA
jgi:hypothetical protein